MTHAIAGTTAYVVADAGTGTISGGVYRVATTGAILAGQLGTLFVAGQGSAVSSVTDPSGGSWTAQGNTNAIGPNAWNLYYFVKLFPAGLAAGSLIAVTMAVNTVKPALAGVSNTESSVVGNAAPAKANGSTQSLTTTPISNAGDVVAIEFNAQQVPVQSTSWTPNIALTDFPNGLGMFVYTLPVVATALPVTLTTTTTGATDYAFQYVVYAH